MKHIILPILLVLCNLVAHAQESKIENVILISVDGLRWQELYGGAMDSIISNNELTKAEVIDTLKKRFLADTPEEAREKLMPFFWNTIAKEGQLYGNLYNGNQMIVSNRFWFSYPGYGELLSGYSDGAINSNAKKYNQNKTVLEFFNEIPEFKGRVAAFASWDVFPYIINDKRSGIPVNAGFRKATGDDLSQKEKFLNMMQDEITGPWYSVRLDAFTHNYALEYMKKKHPRLVYISYGETDDFAHDGRYDHYLVSTYKTDQWIKAVWEFVQNDPVYAGKTALVITTDHGRGTSPMTEWKSHGTKFKGSHEIWAAAIGPGIKPLGEVKHKRLFQNQIARTVAKLLGYDYNGDKYEAGPVIETIVK